MQIDYQGKKVEAKSVDFIERKESWNEYQLTDGKVLKMKTVVSRILKLENEKDREGNPVYILQSTNVVAPVE